MKKRLVFNFYVDNDSIDCYVNNLHFTCLSKYINVFDEYVFVISLNDTNDARLIKKAIGKVMSLKHNGNIRIKISKNNEFRESQTFYDEVVNGDNNDAITFFAHNKGITNVKKYDKENIYYWIVGMYYFSLSDMNEVTNSLFNKKTFSYGSFLTHIDKGVSTNKYNWFYIGTFFWVNMSKIKQYIGYNNIEMPKLTDRFYDEEFLGNIFKLYNYRMAQTFNEIILENAVDFYTYSKYYISLIDKDNELELFYSEIIKEVGN